MNPIVIFAVIILAGIMLGGIINSILRRFFSEVRFDDRVSSLFKSKRNYARATRHAIVRTIYLVTVVIALQYAGILLYAIYLLALIVAILALIKLFERAVVLVPNLRARPALRSKVHAGEVLTVVTQYGSITGIIERIGLINSAIREDNGDLILVPNITLLASRVVKQK